MKNILMISVLFLVSCDMFESEEASGPKERLPFKWAVSIDFGDYQVDSITSDTVLPYRNKLDFYTGTVHFFNENNGELEDSLRLSVSGGYGEVQKINPDGSFRVPSGVFGLLYETSSPLKMTIRENQEAGAKGESVKLTPARIDISFEKRWQSNFPEWEQGKLYQKGDTVQFDTEGWVFVMYAENNANELNTLPWDEATMTSPFIEPSEKSLWKCLYSCNNSQIEHLREERAKELGY
jgi:hypothetical protein